MYQSEHGRIAGLRERLDDWMERLSKDKTLPFVGLGLIDDLEAMSRYMDGERTDPVVVEPEEDEFAGFQPLDRDPNPALAIPQDFDL